MILLTFLRDDDKYDFIQMSPELADLLMQKDIVEDLAEAYKEERGPGVLSFLTGVGISPFSIKENLKIINDLNYSEAQVLTEMYGHELEKTETATVH